MSHRLTRIAEIITPPHMPRKYLGKFLQRFKDLKEVFKGVVDSEESLENWVLDFAGSNVWYALSDAVHPIVFYHNQLSRKFGVLNVEESIQNILDWGEKDQSWSHLMMKELSNLPKKVEGILEMFNDYPLPEKVDFERVYESIDAEPDPDYPTLEERKKQLEGLRRAIQLSQNLQKDLPTFAQKVSALTKHGKPEQGEVETLYHAAIDTSVILEQGMKTRRQLNEESGSGAGGIGGGPDDVISFTADIEIAGSIVWALRMAVSIAEGKFKTPQIQKLVMSVLGEAGWQDATTFASREHPLNTPEWVFSVFRYFLTDQKDNWIYNPLFSGVDVEDFAGKDISKIGILAADIDMSQVKEYLRSMQEYRVPVSAISNLRKVAYKGSLK